MLIRHRPINEITEQDLVELIDNQYSETKVIDYKRQLYSNNREGTKELLSDVSSFANTSGGHIVFGISESKGYPTSPSPLSLTNPDETIRQLEGKIQDGIEPRIHNVEIGEVRFSPSGSALVIRIPKSWAAPHRVIYGGHDKFYARNSRGKYPLDVHDLRRVFAASESIAERIRSFRMERIEDILGERAPLLLDEGPMIVIHLVPTDAFSLAQSYEITEVVERKELLEPMRLGGSIHLYNLDGYLRWALGEAHFFGEPEKREYTANAYTQFFRNGIIEAIRVLSNLKESTIIGKDVEDLYFQYIPTYLELLKGIGVSPPILIMVSILRVKGCKMGYSIGPRSSIISDTGDTLPFPGIVRNNLILPEVLLQDYDDNIPVLLHPVIIAMWNAGGWPGPPHQRD
jgi:hypothetical protein